MGTITIDDVEHQIDDLTDVVKIKVSRMHEIQNQMNAMNRELAELQVVFHAYVNAIRDDMKASEGDGDS